MASFSIARPGKVSERQYLGDLAGLFDRHRRRSGVALTPESFAGDLAANDSLRSGLFTLCNAISHMGEQDLSPEELLGLVARALGGAGSAEGESGTQIPDDMRDAFLSGYAAWQNRDSLTPLDAPEVWPLSAETRKPPQRETAPESRQEERAAAAAGGSEQQISAVGRRTVQEALSLVRNDRSLGPDQPDLHPDLAGAAGGPLGSMTLGELKRLLEDIEQRAGRIGTQMPHWTSAAREPYRRDRTAPYPDAVIPFPAHRARAVESSEEEGPEHDPVRRRPVPLKAEADDAFPGPSAETDERPRGIDALVAAAPAWANATPTARAFDEDAFLTRHSYLAPSRRPGTVATAPIYAPAPLASPSATAPAPFAIHTAPEVLPQTGAAALPRIGLDAEDDPLLSPMERLEAFIVRLSPRRVFAALAALTVFAGALAGFIAYRTLHPSRVPQFKDLERSTHLSAPPATAMAAVPAAAPTAPTHRIAQTNAVRTAKAHAAATPRALPQVPGARTTSAAVWPPAPESSFPAAPAPASSIHTATSQALYVPAPTMIGYALASPQPAYPAAQAHGISGTVAVELTVSRLGDVIEAHAVGGPEELRSAAVAAVRGWRFRPYMVDGRAAEITTTLQFFFKGE